MILPKARSFDRCGRFLSSGFGQAGLAGKGGRGLGGLAALALTASLFACGGGGDDLGEVATTTTRPATTTTRLATTTSTVSGCDAAVDESIGALGTLLDRFEADPEASPNFTEEARTIFYDLGFQAGQECGSDGAGPAVSAVVIFLAQEAIERPGAGGTSRRDC